MRLGIKRQFDRFPLPPHFENDDAVLEAVRQELPQAKVALDCYEGSEGYMNVFVDDSEGETVASLSPTYLDGAGNDVAIDEVHRVWASVPGTDTFELTNEAPRIGYSVIDEMARQHICSVVDIAAAIKAIGAIFREKKGGPR
jgi:hypothetical protein